MITIKTPDEIYGELFTAVQGGHVFPDSKTFVDASPKIEPAAIVAAYENDKTRSGFDLKSFVMANFNLAPAAEIPAQSKRAQDVREHIERMWSVLRRDVDTPDNSSLISLPHPYIVPGGRFREIYYWDSYFTMLGLAESGHADLVEHMVNNFAFLLDEIGLIPNGNRTYYCSRSQPPFFALMVELLANLKGDDSIYAHYLAQLEIEYAFWMEGADRLRNNGDAHRRVVRVGDVVLNRNWDDNPVPRQESYLEDVELARNAERPADSLYRDIRAACETGWDFSSRWLEDPGNLATIRTTQIVPVDLNCLLYKNERVLAAACQLAGDTPRQKHFESLAERRRNAVQDLFFDRRQKLFADLLLPDGSHSKMSSLAAAYPLFFKLANRKQASDLAVALERDFLKPGGWVSTPRHTTQQWDSPNGWAPLQWLVYTGLCQYGFDDLAERGARNWVENNLTVFRQTGNLLEKYDVEQVGAPAGGGEYEVQYGFGWTNAVLLKLMNRLGM